MVKQRLGVVPLELYIVPTTESVLMTMMHAGKILSGLFVLQWVDYLDGETYPVINGMIIACPKNSNIQAKMSMFSAKFKPFEMFVMPSY